jgi:hypothetical protein
MGCKAEERATDGLFDPCSVELHNAQLSHKAEAFEVCFTATFLRSFPPAQDDLLMMVKLEQQDQ